MMLWLWLYLGGALAWVLVMFVLIEVSDFQDSSGIPIQAAVFLLTPLWPLGAAMVIGTLIGEALKPKARAK